MRPPLSPVFSIEIAMFAMETSSRNGISTENQPVDTSCQGRVQLQVFINAGKDLQAGQEGMTAVDDIRGLRNPSQVITIRTKQHLFGS